MKWLVFFPHHREEPIFSSNPPFSSKRRNRRRTFERNTLQTEIGPDRQTERDVNDDDAPEGERSVETPDDEKKKTNKAAKTR